MSNNTQLPAEVVKEIKRQSFLSFPDKDQGPFRIGYQEGATEYATKLHTLQVEFNNIRKANDKWEQAFNMAQRGYDAAYNDLEKLKQKFDELKEKYDNILATEDGHLSQTENVWQSGYATGHDLASEKHKQEFERIQQSAIHYANRKDEVESERDQLKEPCDKMKAALRWALVHIKDVQIKHGESIANLVNAINDALAWKGKEPDAKLTPEQISDRKEAIEWYRNPEGKKEGEGDA